MPLAGLKGGAEIELTNSVGGPVAGAVFKTIIDRYVGRMSYVRVYSGKIAKDAQLTNVRNGKTSRIANLFSVRGKDLQPLDELVAGDIGVITKVDDLQTSDTLTTAENPVQVVMPAYPRPLFAVAITPSTQADSTKMGPAVNSLAEEDPTLRVQTVSATHQTLLQGMGDSHVDVAVHRLASKFGVNVETAVPKVPYRRPSRRPTAPNTATRSRPAAPASSPKCTCASSPCRRGSGFEFGSEVFGGAISSSFYPSIEKGVRSGMDKGVIAGYPVVDVKAIVYDGKEHPVDSKDIAFQTAGREAFKQAFQGAGAVLLEPIYIAEVVVPDEFMGDVMGDFNTRRGRVQGMEQRTTALSSGRWCPWPRSCATAPTCAP